jgi:hypothetical protein
VTRLSDNTKLSENAKLKIALSIATFVMSLVVDAILLAVLIITKNDISEIMLRLSIIAAIEVIYILIILIFVKSKGDDSEERISKETREHEDD